jgi:uncharacterized membrane protein HdeD (DUF308 family)/ElaB/YqjD/DUF883 family membrane-anchored ribosome-binding protein
MTDGTWLAEAKKNSGLLIFLGVLTVIFGVMAIAAPLITGITVAVFVGFLLLFTGIMRIVYAFKSGQWGSGIWGTILGLLGAVAGLLLIFRPMVGLLTLTLLLAIYFFVDGISEIIAAFKIKPDQGWGWVLFNGVIALLLGIMIWRQWPMSGAWAVGVLVGVHILITGWTMIVLGTGARRIAGKVEDVVEDVVDTAGDAAESAADKAKDFAEDVGDKAEDMADRAGDAINTAAEKTEDFVKDTADKTGDAVDDVFDKAKDLAGDVADKAEDVVDDVVDKAKDTFGGDKD